MNFKEMLDGFEKNKKTGNFSTIYLISMFLLGAIGIYIFVIIALMIINSNIGNTLVTNLYNFMGHSTIENFFESIYLFLYYSLLIIAFIIMVVANREIFEYIKENIHKNAFLEGICIGLMMLCCAMSVSIIISNLFNFSSNSNQSSLNLAFEASPFFTFFPIVIFAPICEELTYRFGLFGALAKKSRLLAYVITMLVFSLIHFDFTSSDIINELLNLPVYLIGAGFLCYAYDRKGNILTSITAHMFYNGLQYILMLVSLYTG